MASLRRKAQSKLIQEFFDKLQQKIADEWLDDFDVFLQVIRALEEYISQCIRGEDKLPGRPIALLVEDIRLFSLADKEEFLLLLARALMVASQRLYKMQRIMAELPP
jgi:hypothetical protein